MVSGLNEIVKALKSIVPTSDQITASFKPVGDQILSNIKTELPKRSGQLANAYTYVRRKYKNGLTIGASYGKGGGNHAHLIELGFKTRSKQGGRVEGRFVERKVFDQIRTSSLNEMEKNLTKEIEKNWNK